MSESESASGQPVPGQLYAGRYEIEAVLGQGGMGAVYRAYDREVGDLVALKTLRVRPAAREEAVARFRREVRLARRITDRHVARIHDLTVCSGTTFLTMEFVEGESLDHVLEQRGRLGVGRVASIGRDICDGLKVAHEVGVVHRDLKPANVMVEQGTQRIVITDFGIARSVIEEDQSLQTSGSIGTPLYMAPEQVSGGDIGPRTDLYALGVVLFELLSGVPPFVEDTAMATAVARLHRDAPELSSRVAAPDAMVELVRRLLARKPESRPASAAEVAAELAPMVADDDSALDLTMPSRALAGGGPTLLESGRTLAVLPFGFRGDSQLDYLGGALADGLIDVLSRTRGLRVLASSATAALASTEPRALGREVDADLVVEGAVQAVGERLRVTAKLIDVATGVQKWSERFDSELTDIFAIEDAMSRRIAEALRLGLSTVAERGDAPAEAIECYLRARGRATGMEPRASGAAETVRLYERCLELAPDFRPAMSGHAVACLIAWTTDWAHPNPDPRNWEDDARASVARAVERAGDIAETHIAASRLASQDRDIPSAVRALERALAIAPTCAEAHQFLGQLQCEAGRLEEGLRRLQLSVELDSTMLFSLSERARYLWLAGRHDEAHQTLAEIRRRAPEGWLPGFVVVMRIAAWEGDRQTLSRYVDRAADWQGTSFKVFNPYLQAALDPEGMTAGDVDRRAVRVSTSPRLHIKALELLAESLAMLGASDECVEVIGEAEQAGLFDLAWLERCPALQPVRERAEFRQITARVRHQVFATWSR